MAILPTKAEKRATQFSDYKILLVFGEPKTGKSSFANTFPSAIFVDFENGLAGIECCSVKIETVEQLRDVFKALRGEEGKAFKTVVVDTVDFAALVFEQSILAEKKCTLLREAGAYGAGYDMFRNKMRGLLVGLKGLPQQIVLLCHATAKQIVPKSGEPYTIVSLAIRDKDIGNYVLAQTDIALYLERVTVYDEDTGEEHQEHRLHTRPDELCVGVGSRAKLTGRIIRARDNEYLSYDMLLADYNEANGLTPRKGEKASKAELSDFNEK
jgi:hypothetical protein